MNKLELSDLIGSRICHDLISPLGAIGNGVEFMTMSGMPRNAEITLISESVENANARIRFFRIAFGSAADGSMIGNNELRSILADMYRGNRLVVDWKVTRDVVRAEAKLAFLILQCLESAFPWGGKILVTQTDNSWNAFGGADRLKVDSALWGTVAGTNSGAAITASNVQFAMVRHWASRLGRQITTNITDKSISVSF